MPKNRVALFPRKAQNRFVKAVLAAPTLAEAIAIIRAKSAEFPETPAIGWNEALAMVSDGIETGAPRFKVITRKGNKKLRFASFSAIPVFGCPGAGACALFCYSLKAWQYPGAFARQLQNSLLLRFAPELVAQEFRALPGHITFRLYVDGDFDSLETVDFWFGLLRERSDINVYGYSKSWDILAQREFPANYWLNLSSGARVQKTSVAELLTPPQTRGQFIAVETDYHGARGFERYRDKGYHRAVIDAAKSQGIDRPFSCPGTCHTCTKIGPACGIPQFKGRNIVIGIH